MTNIVFISDSYYRKASPNGICVQQVAEELVRQGSSVSVVTLYNDVKQPSFEEVNGVGIYRVNAGFIETSLYKNQSQRSKIEKLKYGVTLRLSRLNGLFHAFRYPLLSERQVGFLYRLAKELQKKQKIDYVVCAYHKIADVLAGIKLKKKYPDIKLILYTLDAISGGWVPNILHSAEIPMNSLKRWERYFFSYTDKIFAMESHREWYQAKEYDNYRDKIEFLDIPLLALNTVGKEPDDNQLHAVFTGSMHKATANPQYLLKLLPYLPDIRIELYGNIGADILDDIHKAQLNGHKITVHGAVSHDEILQIQANADVLLNFGNANPNMIPCKLFEYISTMNKIISFTHADTDSSLPYMLRYDAALIIEEKDEMIKENAKRIREFLAQPILQNQSSVVQKFKKNTPAYFAAVLLEV